uniref:NADH-ubiquinone oxidoreductase chain 6 n=1 Tax=Lethrinus laticaudis TaxID=182655 RepID=A0A342KCV9_LETLA|nr:NADH dehydrogenase subunit 6 [Lethrinus laticaudis]ANH79351.1 NADH dehydrogenase subunit 6 [Lethrinus laticaudis]
MTVIMNILLLGLLLGLIAVASNPSPYFAALGLVVVSGFGCGVLLGHGGSFLSLVLFLIYLGGMLVVFAYSAALAAEPYPQTWGDRSVLVSVMFYLVSVAVFAGVFSMDWYVTSWGSVEELEPFSVIRADAGGVASMYNWGGEMLFITAGVLLLALFVVLELTRGLNRGALRAV